MEAFSSWRPLFRHVSLFEDAVRPTADNQDRNLRKRLQRFLPHLDIEIVKRSDQVSGFVVLPKRWIVERTIAGLNRCRKVAKDWRISTERRFAFLRLASIRLMLRKLCNPA